MLQGINKVGGDKENLTTICEIGKRDPYPSILNSEPKDSIQIVKELTILNNITRNHATYFEDEWTTQLTTVMKSRNTHLSYNPVKPNPKRKHSQQFHAFIKMQ